MPRWQSGLMVPWAAPGVLPAVWGRLSFPSTQRWWGHTCGTGSSSAPPSAKETKLLENPSIRWWRDWSVPPVSVGRGWNCWAWRGFVGSSPRYMITSKGRLGRDVAGGIWMLLYCTLPLSDYSLLPFHSCSMAGSFFYLRWTFWGQGNIFILLW